ncbi:NAD(P)-dependent oxidoreductase [Gallaecimonas kandeliae]|uniref:NAD(P)-dependent oxidoreductase n=1 Tax=Gallaecimonas kandeliae TaxID=3029055 RepID=UPI0026489068|nr:NAD(P)-dependent oxidoreductase [Gallaecimonas kandeliae]WKE64638.1 NAD(P)-dependent oxidoreductase [Gallaecimonas kandeliae]
MKIGFIGLGTMGLPMAANLLKAGYPLKVWNRGQEPVQQLVAKGAEAAAGPADFKDVDVLISMLADDKAAEQVLIGGGTLDALAAGAVHVNMATISLALAGRLDEAHRQRGLGYVAAPVLGRVNVAEAGMLNILAAGQAGHLAKVAPLLDVLGQKTWHFGEVPSQANVVKLAANFCLASAIETMGEASALVRAHGASGSDFIAMLTNTVFAAPAYQGYGAMIAEARYSPAGFKLSLGLKDMRLALEAAEAGKVPLPFASTMKDNFIDALAHGDGELDWAALATVAARRAGLA